MSDSSNSFWQALPALKERQRRTGLLAALVLGLAVLVLVDGLQALMRAEFALRKALVRIDIAR